MPLTYETYPITGIQNPGSIHGQRVPLRIEVDEFFIGEQYTIQRTLFYLAMTKFQKISPGEKLSYFQIAGIHGLPHITWDGLSGYHSQYCTHNNTLFGTWHRVYMALFEQRLHEIMINEVIPEYDIYGMRDVLVKEANSFRLPYWDWAAKKKRTDPQTGETVEVYDLPLIVLKPTVKVWTGVPTIPTKDVEIPNPLYCFRTEKAMAEYGVTSVQISGPRQPYEATPSDRAQATSRCPENPNSDTLHMDAFISGV
ncbi:hypothetical protein VKT23_010247 [Stygiomarasmius scandens]|uniref:tyrosinase n=1 Tax=Marasmiellus scandens TaxID=2682957 RepID=A0ABR1JGJ4_9AGAR